MYPEYPYISWEHAQACFKETLSIFIILPDIYI